MRDRAGRPRDAEGAEKSSNNFGWWRGLAPVDRERSRDVGILRRRQDFRFAEILASLRMTGNCWGVKFGQTGINARERTRCLLASRSLEAGSRTWGGRSRVS